MTRFFFSYEQKSEILNPTSLLECCNLQKDLMTIEHSKNFKKKKTPSSLNIQKTFQCNDFHNIFEPRTGTNRVENHLSNMELLINEDMYDVAIPIWVLKDSLIF